MSMTRLIEARMYKMKKKKQQKIGISRQRLSFLQHSVTSYYILLQKQHFAFFHKTKHLRAVSNFIFLLHTLLGTKFHVQFSCF